jgi:hypothetical protein
MILCASKITSILAETRPFWDLCCQDTIEHLEEELKLMRIISGGQTGVDRAALDVGLELAILVGGYCPKGRQAVECHPMVTYREGAAGFQREGREWKRHTNTLHLVDG